MNTSELNFQIWKGEVLPLLNDQEPITSINNSQIAARYIKQAIEDFENGQINFAANNLETALGYTRFTSPELSSMTIKGMKILRESQCGIRPDVA